MKNAKEIILIYQEPIYQILTKTFAYKTHLVFMLMMLIAALFDYQKNNMFDLGKAFAGFIVLTIIMLLFQIFIYINFIPTLINLKKYKRLIIGDSHIQINDTRYKISELTFQQENHHLYRHPLAWTYLLIKDSQNKAIGKFICEINSYNFFGIPCDTILLILSQKKEGINKDYHKYIFNSNINVYLESKKDKSNLEKALVIILIPLFLLLGVFVLLR